jgi:hypothetical protein
MSAAVLIMTIVEFAAKFGRSQIGNLEIATTQVEMLRTSLFGYNLGIAAH